MIKDLIKQFNDNNLGIAWHYPRKHQVRINGGKTIPEFEAIKYLKMRLIATK